MQIKVKKKKNTVLSLICGMPKIKQMNITKENRTHGQKKVGVTSGDREVRGGKTGLGG